MSESPPASEVSSNLTLQTIVEQQGVIRTLHEIITTLKERITCLEGVLSAKNEHVNQIYIESKSALGEEEEKRAEELAASAASAQVTIDRLTKVVDTLTLERDESRKECAALKKALDEQSNAMLDVQARCIELQRVEEKCRSTRSLLGFVESRCMEAEQHSRRLEEEVDATALERARWKALATSIAGCLDNKAKHRALQHIKALEMDGRLRAAARSASSQRSCSSKSALSENMPLPAPTEMLELADNFDGMLRAPPLPQNLHSPHSVLSFTSLQHSRAGALSASWGRHAQRRAVIPMSPETGKSLGAPWHLRMGPDGRVEKRDTQRFLVPL
ncbi:hypothetical protein ERJ75_000650600 [Trypanosoma vivax]|nr:hypothetical protein ERJ75_000650600 [Trypanosoma vivax]